MASIIDKDRFRGRDAASHGQGGGGGVDDIVKRLENVESAVTEIRADVREIKVILPTLATKAELAELRGEVHGDIREVRMAISPCATKAELSAVEGSLRSELKAVEGSLRSELRAVEGALRSEIHALEARITKWIMRVVVSAVGAASAVCFSIAKFIS